MSKMEKFGWFSVGFITANGMWIAIGFAMLALGLDK